MSEYTSTLEPLENLLFSLPPENNSMLLSELDGFFTGLALCPVPILPSEWLPIIWGDRDELEFQSEEQMQDALDLIMVHYSNVLASLMPPAVNYSLSVIN